jgi:F420H(2)-dependent quinone reductase
MEPQNYSARVAYRPPGRVYRRLNSTLGVLLTSLGLAPHDAVVLAVRGRSSGKTRRIPILMTRYRDVDYLIALAGESQWVRNVRAAQGHARIRRGRQRSVLLREVPARERAPIIAEYLRRGRQRSGSKAAATQSRSYFGLAPDASLEELGGIAGYYPVFQVIAGR